MPRIRISGQPRTSNRPGPIPPPGCDPGPALAAEVARLHTHLSAAQARADTLEIGLRTSRRIGAAVGIVMSRYCLTIEVAFDLLCVVSQRSNRKVRDLAEDILYTGALDTTCLTHPRGRSR